MSVPTVVKTVLTLQSAQIREDYIPYSSPCRLLVLKAIGDKCLCGTSARID